MTLGRRQLQSIDEILREGREEIDSAYNARKSMQSKSRLTEALMFEEANLDNFENEVTSEVEQDALSMAQDFLADLDTVMFKKLAGALQRYSGEKLSPTTLRNDVEDFDGDGLVEVQQELVADITAAVSTYVNQVALMVSHAKLTYANEEEM